jgi:hypothetical protein
MVLKKGTLVTVWQLGWKRRDYGHITEYLGKHYMTGRWYAVEGQFGLARFHESVIRVVKVRGPNLS